MEQQESAKAAELGYSFSKIWIWSEFPSLAILGEVDNSIPRKSSHSGNICLSCGLCCNGVIFADVKLLLEEDAAGLLALGMPLSLTDCKRGRKSAERLEGGGWFFTQPCTAHDGCRCDIYSSRPKYCREFDCLLLKEFKVGAVSYGKALKVIRGACKKAEKVRQLLRALGDKEETLALAHRYRRMSRRLRRTAPQRDVAELFGKLSVAFHELSLTLQSSFYPGP